MISVILSYRCIAKIEREKRNFAIVGLFCTKSSARSFFPAVVKCVINCMLFACGRKHSHCVSIASVWCLTLRGGHPEPLKMVTGNGELPLLGSYTTPPSDFMSFCGYSYTTRDSSSTESRNFEKGAGRKTVYAASSSFIANAHNELYAFYAGKGGLLRKNSEPIVYGGGAPPPSPLNPLLL